MAKHFLDGPDVGAMIEHVRRTGVAQDVGCEFLTGNSHAIAMFLDDEPRPLTCQPAGPGVQKDSVGGIARRDSSLDDRTSARS